MTLGMCHSQPGYFIQWWTLSSGYTLAINSRRRLAQRLLSSSRIEYTK
jgi:hypothetical protein